MDTVCVRRFSQQEDTREIILPTIKVTELFPVGHRGSEYFGISWAYAGPTRAGGSIAAGLAHARVTIRRRVIQVRHVHCRKPRVHVGFITRPGH